MTPGITILPAPHCGRGQKLEIKYPHNRENKWFQNKDIDDKSCVPESQIK